MNVVSFAKEIANVFSSVECFLSQMQSRTTKRLEAKSICPSCICTSALRLWMSHVLSLANNINSLFLADSPGMKKSGGSKPFRNKRKLVDMLVIEVW